MKKLLVVGFWVLIGAHCAEARVLTLELSLIHI